MLRRVSLCGRAVREKQIKISVVIVIDPRGPRTHGLDEITLPRSSVIVFERDARCCRNILKLIRDGTAAVDSADDLAKSSAIIAPNACGSFSHSLSRRQARQTFRMVP